MSVAIVVPYHRKELLPEEQVSLRHLWRHLSGFPRYQISPQSSSLRLEGFTFRGCDNGYFTTVKAYDRLMLSKGIYESFSEYEHILIYQLDCLVFRNDLEWWCNQEFDYIGAPLFKVKGRPDSGFSQACNGGLSLRKVKSFLAVLESSKYVAERASFVSDVFHQPFVEVRPLSWLKRWGKRLEVARAVRQGVKAYAAGCSVNEDHFWSARASYFDPAFRVAPPETALQFAFEAAPAWCFERNGRKLPFGAHAWQKWDRAFWEPRLLS